MRADETIRKAAVGKNDHRMLAVVSRELVAAKACYHKSCCRISCSRKTPLHAGGHVLRETRHLVCVIWSCARSKSYY